MEHYPTMKNLSIRSVAILIMTHRYGRLSYAADRSGQPPNGGLGRTTSVISSVPANPMAYREFQPDGSLTPQLYFNGHGMDNYVSDEEGYEVLRDNAGWYVYAEEVIFDNGDQNKTRLRRRTEERKLVPGRYRVGAVDPSQLDLPSPRRDVRPQQTYMTEETKNKIYHEKIDKLRRNLVSIGKFQSLVVLIRFKDHKDRPLPTRQQISDFYNMDGIDDEVAPTGSIRQLFLDNSYGLLDSKSYVTDWITLPRKEAYYANMEYGFVRFVQAIEKALNIFVESMVPPGSDKEAATAELMSKLDLDGDGKIDGLGVLHSGYGAEYGGPDCYEQINENRIWSHQANNLKWEHPSVNMRVPSRYYAASSLRNKCNSNIVRLGIVSHEIGHQIGLPDLYDRTWAGSGLGNFDQMARCWGWDGTGTHPPHLSTWSKMDLNWIQPVEITSNGRYSLGPSAITPQAYIITQVYPDGEYLLIENRQPMGYDSPMPGGGIAIWHIDEKANKQNFRGFPGQEGWPDNGNHYRVALLQADGKFDLEQRVNNGDGGDLWHRHSNHTVLGPSAGSGVFPNTDSYQRGNMYQTGLRIFNFTESGEIMSFSVDGLHGPASTSYPTASVPTTPSPTTTPSESPSYNPSAVPTVSPSVSYMPSTSSSQTPSFYPAERATFSTTSPTLNPSSNPTQDTTHSPTTSPARNPTSDPTDDFTFSPTPSPSHFPTSNPIKVPTSSPSTTPTNLPSYSPSQSSLPSSSPSGQSSSSPSSNPSSSPSEYPTLSNSPSTSMFPSTTPSYSPSGYPTVSASPSTSPVSSPSGNPTLSYAPSGSIDPTFQPTPSAPPTIPIHGRLYYYPDWVQLGCNRKSLIEFKNWERMRFENLADCCNGSFSWDFYGCATSSVQLIYTSNGPLFMTNGPDQ